MREISCLLDRFTNDCEKKQKADLNQFRRLPLMPLEQHVYYFSVQQLHYLASSLQQHNQPGEVDPEIMTTMR